MSHQKHIVHEHMPPPGSGWYSLSDDGARRLSTVAAGSAGKSGNIGYTQRRRLCKEGGVLGPVLSVIQIHSLNILKVARLSGGWLLTLNKADWVDERMVPGDVEDLGWISDSSSGSPSADGAEASGGIDVLVSRVGEIEADGILTDDPTLGIAVTVADCMPIFFQAGKWRAVLHSGWAGTGILGRLMADPDVRAASNNGTNNGVSVTFGPCISSKAYEVSPDRAALFSRRFGSSAVVGRNLDIRQANREILHANEDFRGARLVDWTSCTVDDSGLFSYRRMGPEAYSLMLALYAGQNQEGTV